MGAQCLSTTPNEIYSKYFEGVKVSELKDHWSTVKVYKIKKIYDKASQKHPQYAKHTHLPYQKFVNIFPELKHYQQIHKKRIFDIFDRDSRGFLDWSNFYSSISICYFADLRTLATLMFMIFDESLSKELTSDQLLLMIQLNQSYIQQEIQNDESVPMFFPQDIHAQILKKGNTIKNSITIDQWLDKVDHYFDVNRFRNMFNVFIEQKLEKQLIENFNQWNSLYNEEEERYISYLISYKWFQSWKIYVLQAYGKNLSPNARNPTTKTIKTKKSIKTNKDIKSKNKLAKTLPLRQLKFAGQQEAIKMRRQQCSSEDGPQDVKNFDFIHSNIGERPRQIYNNVLEGEFQQVLKPELVQNSDYVLVSEKVWLSLKAIYQGFPEFRRTGYDFIELYPKILKIYSQLFKGRIDYSSEIMREVSSYLTLEELLTKSIEIPQENLKQIAVFYKTIGMLKWQEITDLSYMFTQITPQLIIFLVYIDKAQIQAFKKNHQKIPKQIVQLNVGDRIAYHDVLNGMKIQKNLLFMGKNTQGKYVLHTPGESYIYDFAVMEEELYKKGSILTGKNMIEDVKLKKKTELEIIGISNTKGIGFINSIILNLFAMKNFRQNISFIKNNNGQISKIIEVLNHVNSLISSKKKVDARDILDMVEILLPDFQSFEVGMCYNFMNQFLRTIQEQFIETGLKDLISQDFQFNTMKAIKCGKCRKTYQTTNENLLLSVPIPENVEKYYEIIYVPYCQNFKPHEIKRYGFALPENATFGKYKQTFQKLAEITKEKYIMAEVYNNNIIKNYSTVKQDATLSSIYLRDTDVIYAFELCTDFDKFIAEHYTAVKNICNKDFKIDQFIDCKNEERGWIFGKISQIQFLPYTHRTVFRVIHKFSKNEQWQICYDLFEGGIASFPTKSYLNAEQYHIRLLQRYFNEPSNQMQLCNIPLVVVLTNWMRWKQFYYLIYLQIKRFIADQFKFKEEEEEEGNMQIYSSKSIHNDGGKSPRKNQTKKIKLNKFKEYLYGDAFPYVVHFVDRDGRCAICFKFLKTRVLKGQNDSYCQGCTLSFTQPISWQIKASDIMICIDWKSLQKMKRKLVKDHSSYANLLMHKKNDVQNLENCVNNKLGQSYTEQIETFCCSTTTVSQITEKILKNPNNLVIYLERVVEEDGFKKIMNKQVNFEMDEYHFNKQVYKLIGVTSINGGNQNIQYKTYVLNIDGDWIQYDGEIAKIVKKSIVQKLCAFTLYYRKKSLKETVEKAKPAQLEKKQKDLELMAQKQKIAQDN